MMLTSFNTYAQRSFAMMPVSDDSPLPLFMRSIIRVNKILAHSHELGFALIKSYLIDQFFRPVARSFSKRPAPSASPMQSAVARCFSPRSFRLPAQHHQTKKRQLIAGVENLWDKYAVSSQQLETEREATLGELNSFLEGLGYV